MFHKEYIDLSDDIICEGKKAAKGVLGTKIGSALLRHLAKYPDVLNTEYLSSDAYMQILDKNTPQKDDL